LDQHQIVESWQEVPVDSLSARTHIGKVAKLAASKGWEVKLAKTVVSTEKRGGKIVTEDFLWLGGAKPDFNKPDKVFLFNKFYASANMRPCTFEELKDFVSV
jgi:hypothetical protein